MIYDITQELFSCRVWPGDPAPSRKVLADIGKGDIINLTAFSMCAHNGTHLDAPAHFIKDGKTIGELDPSAFLGHCYVAHHEGNVTAADATAILERASEKNAAERILIGGKATVTEEAARVFAASGIKLLGNESQTVGPEEAPMAVHLILLGADVVLLEGIVLSHVPEGRYFLTAAPLNLGGCEGAPCRAMLVGENEGLCP
jgi:arylformamidase